MKYRFNLSIKLVAAFLILLGHSVAMTSAVFAQNENIAAEALEQRQKLATELHGVWKLQEKVAEFITQISASAPPSQRQQLETYLRQALDPVKIENISITSAAETFTIEEMQAMLSYYTSPEGISAESKREAYEAKVFPEIQKLMDKAIADSAGGLAVQ